MSQMKEKSSLERCLGPFERFSSGVVIETESIIATSLINVIILIVSLA
jgi:hypothetical protein